MQTYLQTLFLKKHNRERELRDTERRKLLVKSLRIRFMRVDFPTPLGPVTRIVLIDMWLNRIGS